MSRLALVTGGTRGIGEAISIALHGAGYEVVASYVGREDQARTLTAATGIRTMRFDVGNFAACADAVASIERQCGPIDILVNNAGITRDTMLHKMTEAQWHEVLATNLTSCFNMCHAVIAGMRERGFGRIINIASINGQTGQLGQTNYAAAKAGMLGFTKSLAIETASCGVTVNAIAPGYVGTDMVKAVPMEALAKVVARIPVGRLGEPEEVAGAVLFLCAETTRFITGATININGGQFMQ